MAERWTLSRRGALTALATLPGTILRPQPSAAEDPYPARPVRLIVPYPAGGPTDVMGRLMAQALSERLGKQVFVDNRPGAGSTLGGKLAATAEPDGYTLLVGSAASLAIGPTLYKGVEYDPKAFVPIALIASVPYLMIAGPQSPFKTVRDVVAYAKTHPGKLTVGVPNGAPPHMLSAWFKKLTATDMLIVPYKGGANDMTDLMGGQVDLAIETTSVVLPHLADGSMRALGTPWASRLPDLPDVPTMIESGIPDFVAFSWTGIVGPPGTPAPMVDKLNAAANAALRSADFQAKLKKLGATPMFGTPADCAAFLATDLPKWVAMAKLSGITGE